MSSESVPVIPILTTLTKIGRRGAKTKPLDTITIHPKTCGDVMANPINNRHLHIIGEQAEAKPLTKKERKQQISKIAQQEEALPQLIIEKSIAHIFSYEEMCSISVCEVNNENPRGMFSVNDPRMGVVGTNEPCATCSGVDCNGHFGIIKFNTPIFNPRFIKDIISILTSVCNTCGGLLLSKQMMEERGLTRLPHAKRLMALRDACKGLPCIRKIPDNLVGANLGKLIGCKANPEFDSAKSKENERVMYSAAKHKGEDKNLHPMTVDAVKKILSSISPEDSKLMGFTEYSHPSRIIMDGILVIPPIARPPVYDGGSILPDQLTSMYIKIVRYNNAYLKAEDKNAAAIIIYEAVRQLIDNPEKKPIGNRDLMCVTDRVQGKTGVLRGTMMGKRVNYCARTVLGPDTSLRFGQIRVPEIFAPILTRKVTVSNLNKKHLQKLLENGRITHITSNHIRHKVLEGKNYNLNIGDVVERWLQNGDVIPFNRQPTLSKQSLMAYDVVLGKPLTFGLHLSATSAHNADFDGDEGNMWDPQSIEVTAEAKHIMHVKECIMSTQNNKPIFGLVMDSVTGAFILTDDKMRVDDDLFEDCTSIITEKSQLATLDERLDRYGIDRRSGKALFSALLPEDFYYVRSGVVIIDGVLIRGRITKKHVGATHRSIIQELYTHYGKDRTVSFLTDAPWLIHQWLTEYGFSVGAFDCVKLVKTKKWIKDPVTKKYEFKEVEVNINEEAVEHELAKIRIEIEALGGELEDPLEEEQREQEIVACLRSIKGLGARLAKECMIEGENAIGIMAAETGGGAKGALFNVAQIMGSLGQPFYRGQRLKPTLTGGTRWLPMFDENDPSPEARGFCANSFWKGMTPEEFFGHMQGGREGIMDTALKTADTGAMHHKIVKALENVEVAWDGSIRNTIGTIFQFVYSTDGYDVSRTMKVPSKIHSNLSSFVDIGDLASQMNSRSGWISKSVSDKIDI